MEKWQIAVVCYWTREDFENQEDDKSYEVSVKVFGKGREAAEERAMEKWRAAHPDAKPLYVWAFGPKEPVKRSEWIDEWKRQRALKLRS